MSVSASSTPADLKRSPEKTSAPLSILHVAAPAPAGGLETVVQSLAIGHHEAGHRVLVAAIVEPGRGDHPFIAPLLRAGGETLQLELPARAYLRERRMIGALLAERRPDVLHTHGERTDVLHIGTARRLNVPAVTTVHGSSRLGGRARLHVPVQMCNLRRFASVVAVSRPIHESLAGLWVSRHRLHLVPNGWNGSRPTLDRCAARRAMGLPPEGFVVGWVGRLIPVKQADLFLEAMAHIEDPAISACVVGDGLERDRLGSLASSLGLDGRVTFAGAVERAADLLPAFDAFVLSSASEGTPVVLFEAMAADVPIAATRVGGVPDMLSEEEAILVPPSDPTALAESIEAIRDDPAAARQRVIAAESRLVREFGFDAWLERYESVYRAAIRVGKAA